MRYYKMFFSNGYCGCDEIYLLKTETELTNEDFKGYLDCYYSYSDGFAGFDNDWESNYDSYDDFWDDYIESILDNSHYNEVSKVYFDELVDYGYDVIEN